MASFVFLNLRNFIALSTTEKLPIKLLSETNLGRLYFIIITKISLEPKREFCKLPCKSMHKY